ncbi:hypothetical protein [Bacillus altitudinis]
MLKELKRAGKKGKKVYVGGEGEREGEGIGWDLGERVEVEVC